MRGAKYDLLLEKYDFALSVLAAELTVTAIATVCAELTASTAGYWYC